MNNPYSIINGLSGKNMSLVITGHQRKFKMNIGDRIVGKKTGTLTPSTVVGIVSWDFFASVILKGNIESTQKVWGKHYKDFQSKNIIISQFDFPQKNVSLQEFKKSIDETCDDFTNEVRLHPELYNKLITVRYKYVPETLTVSYPEDDCEVLSESYSTQN